MSDYTTPPPPPGGGYTPPPPIGGGEFGGQQGPVDHPKGMTVLVLGILSLVCCGPLGIVAWVMGNTALREIDAQPGRYSNRQLVQIGRILGIIGGVLFLFALAWLVVFGGFAILFGGDSSS
jgi:hypothetical protein